MNPIDIYLRAKTLTDACIKVALILPGNQPLAAYAKGELIRHASELAIASRGLRKEQVSSIFLGRLDKGVDGANGCAHWLQLTLDQNILNQEIGAPLVEECEKLANIFIGALKIAQSKLE
jgi:hypothetical protein